MKVTVVADLLEAVEDIFPSLQEDGIGVWSLTRESSRPGVHSLLDKIEQASPEPVPAERRSVRCLRTPTLYIFTSGTTGASQLLCSFSNPEELDELCLIRLRAKTLLQSQTQRGLHHGRVSRFSNVTQPVHKTTTDFTTLMQTLWCVNCSVH